MDAPTMTAGELGRRLALYLRAAKVTHSANLRGCPLLPKSRRSASCRGSYNLFLIWIKQLGLPAAARVFDVGANHGDFARAASVSYPAAQIWLFEPLPALWLELENLAQDYSGRWHVNRFAVGALPGELPLQVAADDDTISSFVGFSEAYHHRNAAGTAMQSIKTRVERLDDFCAGEEIDSIDLLKIDVEGFEFEVLAGGSEILRKTTAIIVEVSLIRKDGGDPAPLEQMITLLVHAGFHPVDLVPSVFSHDEPWKPLEYNVLARRRQPHDESSSPFATNADRH